MNISEPNYWILFSVTGDNSTYWNTYPEPLNKLTWKLKWPLFVFISGPAGCDSCGKKTFETKHELLKTSIFHLNWKYIAPAVEALQNANRKVSTSNDQR